MFTDVVEPMACKGIIWNASTLRLYTQEALSVDVVVILKCFLSGLL